MYGNDAGYAGTRLDQTVVRLKNGTPVFIHRVGGVKNVYYCKLSKYNGDRDRWDKCKLDDLDLTPVKLGYVNLEGFDAGYCVRVPKRNDWRQGMRRANIKFLTGMLREVSYREFNDTIIGKYPSFKESSKRSAETGRTIAWHRNWAVGIGDHLMHKGKMVGRIREDKPVLAEKFNWLEESLEEAYNA